MPFCFPSQGKKQPLWGDWFSGQWNGCSDMGRGNIGVYWSFCFLQSFTCPSMSASALCSTPKCISIFFVRIVTLSSKLPIYVNSHIGEEKNREKLPLFPTHTLHSSYSKREQHIQVNFPKCSGLSLWDIGTNCSLFPKYSLPSSLLYSYSPFRSSLRCHSPQEDFPNPCSYSPPPGCHSILFHAI